MKWIATVICNNAYLLALLALSLSIGACATHTSISQIERHGGEEGAVKNQILVLRLSTEQVEATGSRATGTFLYWAKVSKVPVSEILKEGIYFRNLARAQAYAIQEGVAGELQYQATQFLSEGPGPFEDFKTADYEAKVSVKTIYPDQAEYGDFRIAYVAKMRIGNGGFVFRSPSGVLPTEQYAVAGGYYVRDLKAFLEGYEIEHKNLPRSIQLNGRALE